MVNKNIPAISIIIPMYNIKKYIGECLDSVLAQTFTDFEVIVVDDCSTDNGVQIVESYIPKFNNKLQIIKLEKNSGSGGIPRNIGIKVAVGKYIMFIDGDDAITPTALEELYEIATKFDVDVVTCEKWFATPLNGDIKDRNSLKVVAPPTLKFIDKPTSLSNNIADRVNQLFQLQFVWNAVMKLIRRDFILEKNIEFVNISNGEDAVFTTCLICSAKTYVRVPNIIYFYRIHDKSTAHSDRTDFAKVAKRWIHSLDFGFKYLDDFLNRQEFFQQHSDSKYIVLESIVREFSGYFIKFYSKFQPYQLDKFIREEFAKAENLPELTSFLFGRMNHFGALIKQRQAQIKMTSK